MSTSFSNSQVFQIPIVNPRLRPQESLLQLFDALENLDLVVNSIFTKVLDRVATEKSRIEGITNRLNTASNRVEYIKTLGNKATTIFSSAKYPAPEELDNYTPIYKEQPPKPSTRTKYFMRDEPHTQSIHDNGELDIESLRAETLEIENSILTSEEKKEGLGSYLNIYHL